MVSVAGLVYKDDVCVVSSENDIVFLVPGSEDNVKMSVDDLSLYSLWVDTCVSGMVPVELGSVENVGVLMVHHEGIGGIDILGLCGTRDFVEVALVVDGKFRFSCEGN